MKYDWRRFWCPRDAAIHVDFGGFLDDPERDKPALGGTTAVPFSQLAAFGCLVLLGEPGIGKSTAVKEAFDGTATTAAAAGDAALRFDLRAYGDESRLVHDLFECAEVAAWRSGSHVLHLFIDSLDECLLRVSTVAALLADRLAALPLARLRLRIACRTGDWPKLLDDALPELWGAENVGFVELAPLRKRDVVHAAEKNGLDSNAFLTELADRSAVPLAIKPITLKFLMRSYQEARSFPATQAELYARGCRLLCEEQNPSRTAGNLRGSLDASQRITIATRIAAVMTFCRRGLVWTESETGVIGDDELTVDLLAGGTEVAGGVPIAVTEATVRETLSTGLFSSRGAGRVGWAHQTYAECLAAKYLLDHGLIPPQVRALLMHHEDQGQVIPQLQETAAWFASMDLAFFRSLVTSDPQVLLRSDIAKADTDRATLVQGLLEGFEAHRLLDDDWDQRIDYRKLKHPRLAAQLEPYIVDRTKDVITRRVAIDIAEACELGSLQSALAQLALDPTDAQVPRVRAAHAVQRVGDSVTKLLLLPLASGSDTDPNDELKGIALRTLYPEVITQSDVFGLIARPRNDRFYGAYSRFLHELRTSLSPSCLPAALQWAAVQPSRHLQDGAIRDLLDAVLRLAWENALEPAIVGPLAVVVAHRLADHDKLWTASKESKGSGVAVDIDTEARRKILGELIETAAPIKNGTVALAYSHPALVRPEDLPWLLSRLRSEALPADRSRWIELVTFLFARELDASRIDAVLEAVETQSDLASALAPLVTPIVLESDEATRLKHQYEEHKRMLEKNEPPLLDPSPEKRVETSLSLAESGDPHGWSQLLQDLTLEPRSTYYGDQWEVEVTAFPGWQAATESTRSRAIDVAKRFITEADPQNEAWVGQGSIRVVAMDGYRALRLVQAVDPRWLDSLDSATWRRWVPIIIAYPRFQSSAADGDLISRAHRLWPYEVASTVTRLIAKENEESGNIFAHRAVEHCWDDVLADSLLAKAQDPTFAPTAVSELLEHGMTKGDNRFADAAIDMLTLPVSPAQRPRAVDAAETLFRLATDRAWVAIWAAIQHDAAFGRDVLVKAATRIHHDARVIASKLSAAQVADLYIWTEQQFPEREDPKRKNGIVSPRESVADLRDGLLKHLSNCGETTVLKEVDRIAVALPHVSTLRFTRVFARRAVLKTTWRPTTPAHFAQLGRSHDARLVESGEQLLELIIESLARLESAFQGETPEARAVWDDRGAAGYFPNDENSFSDHVKRHLVRDLKERGIVLNREVEIRKSVGPGSGERTDIQVDALVQGPSGSYDMIKVIIEVKGCWHDEVATAIETQLLQRYLRDNDCHHGLYLVGWFGCERWSARDSRKKKVPWATITDARVQLEAQAGALSSADATVVAHVLDATLR